MFLLLNSYTSPDNDLFGLGITLKSILGLKCIYVKRLSPPLNSFDLHYFLNNGMIDKKERTMIKCLQDM